MKIRAGGGSFRTAGGGGGALGQQGAPPCYSSLWETLDIQYCFYYSSTLYCCAIFNSQNAGFFITIWVSNSLDPDQARHFVRPDLGPNCLQRLSADDKSRR